jgi:hypothetical protein
MHQVARHVHIVIFHKGYPALKLAVRSQGINLVKEIFGWEISGMGLAGEYYLNRPRWVPDDSLQTFDIMENQRWSLIFSEAPNEPHS